MHKEIKKEDSVVEHAGRKQDQERSIDSWKQLHIYVIDLFANNYVINWVENHVHYTGGFIIFGS